MIILKWNMETIDKPYIYMMETMTSYKIPIYLWLKTSKNQQFSHGFPWLQP